MGRSAPPFWALGKLASAETSLGLKIGAVGGRPRREGPPLAAPAAPYPEDGRPLLSRVCG